MHLFLSEAGLNEGTIHSPNKIKSFELFKWLQLGLFIMLSPIQA